MTYILIIGVFEAIFLILLLLGKKNKTKPDLFLGIILSLYGLSIFLSYIEIFNRQNGFPFPNMINNNWQILFLHGPALWFYIKSLTVPSFRFKPLYLLHFVPFLFFTIWHYYHFSQLPVEEKIQIALNDSFRDTVFYKITVLAIGFSTITYNLWALILIHSYRKKLRLQLSNIDHIDLNWLRILTSASLIIYLINVTLFNLDLVFHFAPYKMLMAVSYGFASVYVLIIGYFGLQQKDVFIGLGAVNPVFYQTPSKFKKSGRPEEKDQAFVKSLLEFMEKEKPYLEPELSIAKLSSQLHVKSEYLSEILNNTLHQTFFDFINQYRVEEFKKQSADEANRHLSIMGIAYDCGFNSKASFYRAFKKFEKVSPSAYIGQVS